MKNCSLSPLHGYLAGALQSLDDVIARRGFWMVPQGGRQKSVILNVTRLEIHDELGLGKYL